MSSHLLWFRLRSGRVWHVAASGSPVALCGQSLPARGERQPKRPPFGARPCPDCDAVSAEAWRALFDARAKRGGDIPANGIQPEVTRALTGHDHFEFAGATVTSGSLTGTVEIEYVSPEFRAAMLGRTPTDPEDDGDLPDLLGQDGEVTVR